MKRTNYYMEHMSFVPLRVGLLQTIAQFPVIAGDSIDLNMSCKMRLPPLERYLAVDPSVLYTAFYVPHRHIYGSLWTNFLIQGVDEQITLPSFTTDTGFPLNFLGSTCVGGETYPLTTLAGYNRIWNRYFRVPSDEDTTIGLGQLADTYRGPNGVAGEMYRDFGQRCAWMKNAWNTGIVDEVTDDDKNVPVTSGRFSVTDLEQVRARYGSEQGRDFFAKAKRYKDILDFAFGSGKINIDADERPLMLMADDHPISGHDVNGTGDSSLGRYSGKGLANCSFGFPRRYFPEHGTIFIMALLRYPTMVFDETNPLISRPNPSYKNASGDPRIISAEPPIPLTDIYKDYLRRYDNPDFNEKVPFGNEYRCMPTAHIHDQYQVLLGYPFIESSFFDTSYTDRHYVQSTLYDRVFTTEQLGHCTIDSQLGFNVKRLVPDAMSSIFAGAK